ncbi:MAG TPA: DNA topoisomerase III, partial [Candidatus Scatomorpha gallistercoris]|nr:DNA topoisomerase III [Candidatus Scatomorpha gallistercoris]
CYGHLIELATPAAYDEKLAKWRREDLPILPEQWKTTVMRDKRQQFEILRGLMQRSDVGEVVNACDAGREGELIFRLVYEKAGCNKPVKRLWLSSMEPDEIRREYANMRPGEEYDRLYAAALCRAKADWLVGMNATRLMSLVYHRTLNVGRVVSPTLALLVERKREIEGFKPETFYTVAVNCGGVSLSSERISDKSEADALADICTGELHVAKVERREKRESPPALYDLTTLQREANRELGFTAQQTLDYLQSLYEKCLVTYPRTDSRFLTDGMAATVPGLVNVAAKLLDVEAPASINAEHVCDSSKVTDHHAVVPTASAVSTNLSALPEGEAAVLRLVCRQLLCAVSEPFTYAETTVEAECSGHTFRTRGKTIIDLGWRAYKGAPDWTPLPEFAEGVSVAVTSATVKEGKTSPPSAYTEDTLLSAMEHAGAKEAPSDAERRGLGTPATRAATIEKLVNGGFAERVKGKLMLTDVGKSLVTVLPEALRSPLLTAEWESRLKQIERGELDADSFISDIEHTVSGLVSDYTPVAEASILFPTGREVVGKCPRCGGVVSEAKSGYFCESLDCKFGLWRDNKFLAAKRISLTRPLATELLDKGRAHLGEIYSQRMDKYYPGDLILHDDGERATYYLSFKGGKK